MPSFGDLLGHRAEGPTVIPVAPEVKLGFGVYYAPTYPPLSNDELAAKVPAWVAAHVPEPLGPALQKFIADRPLVFNDMAKTALPLPPTNVLREEGGLGEEEERRFNAAFQLVVISATDPNQVPRFGLWAALAGALSSAEALNGVVYDVEAMRMLPVGGLPIPPKGEVALGDHVAVRALSDARGGNFVATKGMAKLGLPELWLPDAGAAMLPFVTAVAQTLLDATLRAAHEAGAPVSQVGVDVLTVGATNVRLGYTPGSPLQVVPVPTPAPA